MRNLDIISKSRDMLTGHWLVAIGVVLLHGLITNIGTGVDESFAFLSAILSGPMYLGVSIYYLNVVRANEARLENLFDGFRNFVPSLVAFLLSAIVIVLGFILLIIPGIILGLGLSQTFFILADNKGMSGVDAMRKSWDMMDGYKLKYFLLQLIHLGMMILGFIMLFIGIFYMLPIIYSSMALFYEKLKKGELQPV